MSLNERLISVGAAACTTDTTDVFGDGSGVALYTMDYDASDEGGLYDGTPTNVEFGVGGQINYGAGFNGSSSKIVTTLNPNGFSQIAISCWIKTTSTAGSDHIVSANDGTNWCFLSMTSGIIAFGASNGGSSIFLATHTGAINDGNWHHVVGNYNGTNATLYIDSIGYTPVSATASLSVNTAFGIGYRNTASPSGTYYDGSIDQVRVFQSALNSTQVTQLYNETACVYTCTTDTADYPTTNLAYYKLDNSATDETGIYDGTPTNINYTFGRFGQAADFSGGASYVNLNSAVLPASVFSVSLWVNLDSLSPAWLFSQYTGGATGRFIFNVTPTGGFQINVTSTNSLATTNIPVITIGNWYHVVIVKDGSNGWTLYANGTPHSTWNSTENILTNQNTVLGGDDSVTGNNMIGRLDQVRIFSSALTSTQVESLYNEYQCEDTSTFKTVLYTGNGSTQYVSNVGFEPDLVWVKNRNNAGENHNTTDVVSGFGKVLYPNLTNAQFGSNDTYFSQLSNGFSVNTGNLNINANNYVAWTWKAGGAAVSNTDGTITSQVSANVDAGFSIVRFDPNFTASGQSGTVGHGLNQAPEIIITKSLDLTLNWWTSIDGITGTQDDYVALNLNTAVDNLGSSSPFGRATNTVFSVSWAFNSTSNDFIAYAFHSVAGYSKIGSYTGNAGTQTVVCGFEPSFVLMKNTSDTTNSHWLILDSARSTTNPRENELYANLSNVEQDLNRQVNFVSNGFELTSSSYTNRSGINYIFLAFA